MHIYIYICSYVCLSLSIYIYIYSAESALPRPKDITALNQQRKEALRIADDLGRIVETANAPIFGTPQETLAYGLVVITITSSNEFDSWGRSRGGHGESGRIARRVGRVGASSGLTTGGRENPCFTVTPRHSSS